MIILMTEEKLDADKRHVDSGFTSNLNAMATYEAKVSIQEVLETAHKAGIDVLFSTVRGHQWFTTVEGAKKLQEILQK